MSSKWFILTPVQSAGFDKQAALVPISQQQQQQQQQAPIIANNNSQQATGPISTIEGVIRAQA